MKRFNFNVDSDRTLGLLSSATIGLGCLSLLAYITFWGFIAWLAYKVVMAII